MDILENTMLPYARNFFGHGFNFQKDNDPRPRSKHVHRAGFPAIIEPSLAGRANFQTLTRGYRSSWSVVLKEKKCKECHEKFFQLEEEWEICLSFFKTLLNSIMCTKSCY
ncbi:hypothetical protein TNCT_580281 [Trichonephila clavata]|uniref:Uncharacterized protein n=1 Tax=Trichonephila clavata TaxID=2740835 RepID=A0A8X6HWV6_TRICU|nr:hypothetical protein TNCT_580281 [Trichonephila clavata]